MSHYTIYILNFFFVYKNILHTLFQGNADEACEHILGLYQRKGFCIVDYLYFANISSKRLFSSYHISYPIEQFKEALLSDYKTMNIQWVYSLYQKAVLDADVVLPDGIALQLFNFLATKHWLKNLNGTDFCPHFLSYIKSHGLPLNIILYGTYPHLLEKTKYFLRKQWYNIIYAQDGYTNLDRKNVDLALKGKTNDINVLLVARTTPKYPIQEIRSFANKQYIRHYWLLVMNQWGTFDFRVGEQKRAPKFIRFLKMEWLWRLFSDPKRNISKVLHSFTLFGYIFSYLLLKKR